MITLINKSKTHEQIENYSIPKIICEFGLWDGEQIKDTYGNKKILNYNNQPVFAELYIVKSFLDKNINAVWVDNFRKKFRQELPELNNGVELPKNIKDKFDEIVQYNKTRNGCWDILAWNRENKLHFYELKELKKDKIRDTQIKWLQSCIELGYGIDNFTIIEWTIKPLTN